MTRPYHAEAFSPDAVIGKIDGIAIVIEAAVLGRSGVLVALTAKRSATTGELQAGWQQEFAQWIDDSRAAREDGNEPPAPPPERGVALYRNVALVLCDDVDTPYRWVGTSMGGSGSEWEALWRFKPAVPAAARTLTVAIDGDANRRRAHVLGLAELR